MFGLFGKKKTQVISFNKNASTGADTNDALFVRISDEITDEDCIVEVPYTHTAIALIGGKYKYLTETGELLDDKEKKAFKKGLSAEVIYIIKDTQVEINWGTPEKLTFRDELSGHVVSMGAFGSYEVSVSNPEQFFRKIVGNNKQFDLDDLSRRTCATVVDEFVSIFLNIVAALHISYDRYDANRKEIGKRMGAELTPIFENKWGLKVENFIIQKFNIDSRDKDAIEEAADPRKVRAEAEARAKEAAREAERLADKQFEQQLRMREMDVRERSAYYDAMGGAATEKCPHCGADCPKGAAFCPACGKRVSSSPVTCPHCGTVNPGTAAFCSSCGQKL